MLRLVCDKAGFEVSTQRTFGSDARAGEVRGADEGFLSIDDNRFGVDAGAKDTFEKIGVDEGGVAIEIFAESRAGFLCVEEADGDSFIDEVREDFEKGNEAAAFFHVEVLNVSGDDPEEALCTRNHFYDYALVDVFVEDEVVHVLRVV